MKSEHKRFSMAAALAVSLCLSVPAKADYYDDALLTYRHGQYLDAFIMFKKLADQGDAGAEYMIGTIWYQGKGKPQNYQEASRWYLRSAYQGNPDSQNSLGQIYREGKVQPANPVVAYAWFSLAAAQSNEDARKNLESLTKDELKDNPGEIHAGQELALEYAERIEAEKRSLKLAGITAPSLMPDSAPTPVGALRRSDVARQIYKVQLGLFEQAESVRKLQAALLRRHYDFELSPVEIRGRTYTQFRIGPYLTVNDAEVMARKVDKTFKVESAIIPLIR